MGNGTAKCNDERLRLIILETEAKILFVSKTNIDIEDTEQLDRRKNVFPGFKFDDETLPGTSIAHLSMFIANKYEHKRMLNMENDTNSTAII